MSEPPAATSTGAIHGPSKLDAEVVSTNPYSRLMALERMGVVPDYSRIRGVSIAIIGVGGVGSVAAEMLVRCGVGRLILFDYDTVELANMNRLFYRPDQAGLTKVHAAKATLSAINPDVDIECFNCDVCSLEGYRTMESRVREGGIPATPHNDSPGPAPAPIPVNLVLSCVDNYTARMAVNKLCNALSQPWIESGVSEHAMSGHIQFILPGRTPCFECVPPVAVETGMDERLIKREGVCAASLPTTMSLVAANLVQNALKYTLGFGRVSYYVGYNAIDDYFPHEKLRRNPWCRSEKCRELQQQWQGWVHPDDAPRTMGVVAAASGANGSGAVQGGVGDDGEEDIAAKWGITVVSEGFGAEPSAPNSSSTSGSAAAPIPTATASGDNGTAATNTDVQEGQDDEESLGDLMSQLGSLMRT